MRFDITAEEYAADARTVANIIDKHLGFREIMPIALRAQQRPALKSDSQIVKDISRIKFERNQKFWQAVWSEGHSLVEEHWHDMRADSYDADC